MRYRRRLCAESELAELVFLLDERVECLERIVERLVPHTPQSITFKEITMLPPVAGNTLVYTGTLSPSGSAFPVGTVFTIASSDPTVTPTVDPTGLIITVPLPSTFVDNPSTPFNMLYTASGITPVPSTSPTTITAAITPSIPVSTVTTPTGITFAQTT